MEAPRNLRTNCGVGLVLPRSKSNSRGGRALFSCAWVPLVVGALLILLFYQAGCSRGISFFGKSQPLSSVDLFRKVSPSVFVVQAPDGNGKTLMLGSGVALARDFLITNCHVVQSGSSLRVSRGEEKWTARLIQAVPDHDLCGLRPGGLTMQPVEVRPSSKLATGEPSHACPCKRLPKRNAGCK